MINSKNPWHYHETKSNKREVIERVERTHGTLDKRATASDHLGELAEDVQNALKELFAETLHEMLEGELGTHLGYEKH